MVLREVGIAQAFQDQPQHPAGIPIRLYINYNCIEYRGSEKKLVISLSNHKFKGVKHLNSEEGDCLLSMEVPVIAKELKNTVPH